jgi:protein-disulfide isomerase
MRKTVLTFLFVLVSCAAAASAQQPAAAPAATPHPCGCEGEPQPEVLATVGAIKISRAEIDNALKSQIEEERGQVVEARKRELDLQINSILLEAEAKKRGISMTRLLEQEVVAKATAPTEAEALAFFNENKARIQQSTGRAIEFAAVKADVIEYLKSERQREAAAKFAQTLRAAYPVTVNASEATPPATPADRARVFATVNGKQITSAMIEDSLRPLVYNVQRRVYNLRKQQLDLQVNDLLLSQEAQKRQLTTRALLDAEVTAKKKPVTEAEALAFYNENKARINGEFAQIKQQIISYLEDQQEQKLTLALAERLRAAAGVQFFLRAPVAPVYEIATDDQPSKGAAAAAVTVVEFTDLQCPSCAQMHPVVERLAAEYGDRVRFVVRDYPLAQHADAQKAAEAAEAAREQGKYWEYVTLLYRNQSALSVPKLKEYATQVGLDRAKFDAALDSGRFAEKVQRDVLDGNRVGVSGTPSFFVNGRFVEERSYEALKAAIEAALKEKGKG